MRPRVGRALRAVAVWLGEHGGRCEAASVRLWYLARAYETGGLRGVVRSGWATPQRDGVGSGA